MIEYGLLNGKSAEQWIFESITGFGPEENSAPAEGWEDLGSEALKDLIYAELEFFSPFDQVCADALLDRLAQVKAIENEAGRRKYYLWASLLGRDIRAFDRGTGSFAGGGDIVQIEGEPWIVNYDSGDIQTGGPGGSNYTECRAIAMSWCDLPPGTNCWPGEFACDQPG